MVRIKTFVSYVGHMVVWTSLRLPMYVNMLSLKVAELKQDRRAVGQQSHVSRASSSMRDLFFFYQYKYESASFRLPLSHWPLLPHTSLAMPAVTLPHVPRWYPAPATKEPRKWFSTFFSTCGGVAQVIWK